MKNNIAFANAISMEIATAKWSLCIVVLQSWLECKLSFLLEQPIFLINKTALKVSSFAKLA